jgi:hypothetical protein
MNGFVATLHAEKKNLTGMSALLPKADIPRRDLDVCFAPKADIVRG